jgi:hypothetical protein
LTHIVAGLAMGLIAPFTGLAWPFGALVGIVIGKAEVDRRHGGATSVSRIVGLLAVTGGVLAMLVFGAILGGIIAFFVAALAAFSERAAGEATPTDRTVARLLILVLATIVWLVMIFGLHLNVSIHAGS